MKNILVTGGFGFLGSHLIELLLKENKVHVVDNLSTSPLPLEYLLSIISNKENLSYDIQDLLDYKPTLKFDEIYHLASVVGPVGVLKHSGKIVKYCVDDSYYVLDLAAKMDAKLVDVSTSEVYGGGRDGYCSETMSKIIQANTTVRLEYAIGKLACEIAIENTVRVTNINAMIARPFNISGPRQSGKGGFVLPRFIYQAINNLPITVFNTGEQIRAFTHVKDTAQGILNVMNLGKRGEIYNIGNKDNKVSILQLAEEVIRLTKSKSKIEFLDPKILYGKDYAEANDKFPDDTKSRNEISWNPKYSRGEVIIDTYKFMKDITDSKLFEYLL